MTRLVVLTLGLLALAATSVAAAQLRPDEGCAEEACADDGCASEADAEDPDGHEPTGASGDDACGDKPCPCDGDDSDCPPNCHDCGCSGIGVSTVAPSGMPSIGCAPETAQLAEPPLERRASGVVSRVFRPPRA